VIINNHHEQQPLERLTKIINKDLLLNIYNVSLIIYFSSTGYSDYCLINTEIEKKGGQRPTQMLHLHEAYTIMTRNKMAMTHTEEYCSMKKIANNIHIFLKILCRCSNTFINIQG